MIHPDDAARIMREVRAFYAAGVKSGNKTYANAPPNSYIAIDDPFDGYWQAWSTAMMSNKAADRNANALSALQNRPAPPTQGSESFYDFGRRIYNGGKRADFASGNCMEMAAVSAVIAIDEYRFAPDWVYIASIGRPGDHAFCLLSIRDPQWANAAAMVPGSTGGVAYVIDPWLNTTCKAQDYWAAAQARVAKWSRDGKRIAWTGVDGQHLGWYDPSGVYAQCFGAGPLTFVHAQETL